MCCQYTSSHMQKARWNNEDYTYPFVPAYALTICKTQGQTLERAILWMDSLHVPAGAAYVALSRVKRMQDLYFMTRTFREQYKPVTVDES